MRNPGEIKLENETVDEEGINCDYSYKFTIPEKLENLPLKFALEILAEEFAQSIKSYITLKKNKK